MTDLQFMREAQRRMREGTVPRVEVIREAQRLLPKEDRHNNARLSSCRPARITSKRKRSSGSRITGKSS